MTITLDGTTGITTPTYGGATTAEYLVPVTNFKNRVINGSMAVDQRNAGASQTITAAAALAYTVDRWYAWATGANGTTQRVAGTAPSQYALKFTGATSNTLCGIAQRIEQLNSYDLASGAVTISAYMTASTNTTITAILNGPSTTADTFGTLASPTVTQIATTTFSVTTTRTLFTWTISAATMSGFNKGLELIFKAASGLGNTVTWTVEQVQLEAGLNATSFEYRDFGRELFLCQRYYEKTFPIGTAVAQAAGFAGALMSIVPQGDSLIYNNWQFAAEKRATPTITNYNPTQANAVYRKTSNAGDSSALTYPVTNGTRNVTWYAGGGGFTKPIRNTCDRRMRTIIPETVCTN